MGSLHNAAQWGGLAAVGRHLDSGVAVDLQTKEGISALMIASGNRKKEVVEVLLQRGAEVNLQNKWGSTALMLAAHNSDSEVVALLLDSGAKLDVQSTRGTTALM